MAEGAVGAWSYERIQQEYDLLRFTYNAKSEAMIRDMARQAVLATQGGQMELGTYSFAGDLMIFPVRSRTGYRDIQVRLLPNMEPEEALIIAEKQIRQQWMGT